MTRPRVYTYTRLARSKEKKRKRKPKKKGKERKGTALAILKLMRVEEKGRGQENVVSLYPKALGLFGFFPVTIFGSRVARERNRGSFYVDAINGRKAAFGRLKRRRPSILADFKSFWNLPRTLTPLACCP